MFRKGYLDFKISRHFFSTKFYLFLQVCIWLDLDIIFPKLYLKTENEQPNLFLDKKWLSCAHSFKIKFQQEKY